WFDARRLLHHTGLCRQRKEEGIGAANGGGAHPDRTLAGGAGGDGTETQTDLPAARVLGLLLRPRRGDVLWQLAPDGAPSLSARSWRQHGGRGLPCLYGGDAVFLADPAQAQRLGRHQAHEARKPAVVPLLGRVGRRVPGLRLRLACRSAADGGDADPPALSGLPTLPVAIDQSRL